MLSNEGEGVLTDVASHLKTQLLVTVFTDEVCTMHRDNLEKKTSIGTPGSILDTN